MKCFQTKRLQDWQAFFYLLMLIFGGGSEIIHQSIFVTGDMAATAKNIMENEFLYRLAFMGGLIMMTSFTVLPLVLYKLLGSVDKNMAMLMVVFVLVSVPINMINLLNDYASIHLLSSAEYLSAFEASQLQAQAILYHDFYLHGYEIASIFFGLWLIPFGILVYKSGFLPRALGVLLVVGGCGLFLNVFVHFLLPGIQTVSIILLIPGTIAEVGAIFWLLIRGINESKVQLVSIVNNSFQ